MRAAVTYLDLGAVRVDPAHPGDGLEREVAVGVEKVRLHDVAVTRALHAHARLNCTLLAFQF